MKSEAIDADGFKEHRDQKMIDDFDIFFKDREWTGNEIMCLTEYITDRHGEHVLYDVMAGDDSKEEREREAYDMTLMFLQDFNNIYGS